MKTFTVYVKDKLMPMISIARSYILFVFAALLSGCTHFQQPSAPTLTAPQKAATAGLTWEQRQQQLNSIQGWTIRGSTSIQHQNKTDMASLTWTQQSRNYNISLFGPLSIGRVSVIGNPNSVTLAQTNKPTASAANPEQLMQKQLGWQLPVSNFYYWVRGIPAPGAHHTQLDNQNHLIALSQQGWNIRYNGYMTVQGLDLPRTIELTNPKLRIKVVIRNWAIRTP